MVTGITESLQFSTIQTTIGKIFQQKYFTYTNFKERPTIMKSSKNIFPIGVGVNNKRHISSGSGILEFLRFCIIQTSVVLKSQLQLSEINQVDQK